MKILLSHPTGNANVRAVAEGFAEAGVLDKFYTTFATTPGRLLYRLGGVPGLSEIRRRSYSSLLSPYMKSYPLYETGRMIAGKLHIERLLGHETGLFCIDRVYHRLDNQIAAHLSKKKRQPNAVYAYEDGALQTFREAKACGIQTLYDLPIGYWRAAREMLQSEISLRPGWAATLSGFRDSEAKLMRKDAELSLADHIYVASSFTAQTLKRYPGGLAPVSVIPYGFPDVRAGRIYSAPGGRKLKLLFVGGLSQRKGIANLFEAIAGLESRVELTVVGQKAVADCDALNRALACHTWIPSMPHAAILELMRTQDVLVFPSLFEGFGLVITEAMSQGTPVITTERTIGPDIIRHGENGWLTAAGSTAELRAKIEDILTQPSQLTRVGQAAMETARLRPWSEYGREMAASVQQIHRR